MKNGSRAKVVSSFTIIKGAMVEETYAIFAAWDFSKSKRENLDRLRSENFIGASSTTWLRDIAKVFNRRFDPDGRDRPLVILAKNGCDLEDWKPACLWHITRDEFLLRDFLQNWLFERFTSGAFRIRPEDLHAYLREITSRGGTTEHAWTEFTVNRVAAGLLKMASDFGLLRGNGSKEFLSYHLPERSFIYLLHAMRDHIQNPRMVIESDDWHMFLMTTAAVERELLLLHQYRKLQYQVAGSIVELILPCANAAGYAERIAE